MDYHYYFTIAISARRARMNDEWTDDKQLCSILYIREKEFSNLPSTPCTSKNTKCFKTNYHYILFGKIYIQNFDIYFAVNIQAAAVLIGFVTNTHEGLAAKWQLVRQSGHAAIITLRRNVIIMSYSPSYALVSIWTRRKCC